MSEPPRFLFDFRFADNAFPAPLISADDWIRHTELPFQPTKYFQDVHPREWARALVERDTPLQVSLPGFGMRRVRDKEGVLDVPALAHAREQISSPLDNTLSNRSKPPLFEQTSPSTWSADIWRRRAWVQRTGQELHRPSINKENHPTTCVRSSAEREKRIMRHLRVCVLESDEDRRNHPSRYIAELSRVGHKVIMCSRVRDLIRALEDGPVDCVIVENLSVPECNRIIDAARQSDLPHRPSFFIATDPSRRVVRDEITSTFKAEGDGRSEVRVILARDLTSLDAHLAFVAASVPLSQVQRVDPKVALPMVSVKHSTAGRPCGDERPVPYRQHIRRPGCSPIEAVLDVILPDYRSLRKISKSSSEPIRTCDVYYFDCLARAVSRGAARTVSDLQMIDDYEEYIFAPRVAAFSPNGISRASVHNGLSRLRRAFTIAGLPGHDIIRRDGDLYYVDRSIVQIGVIHVSRQ